MKYCPKDKSHKNPAEAVFCCECGSRLVEVADNKICPKCGMSNPNEAIFCRECGTKLPDANGNVELTVYSSEICDRILAVGTNSYQTNTSKCVLKVPARKSVDILLQCGGNTFRFTADLTKSNILNVNWGTIEIQCKDCCQVRIVGNNMDTSLIKDCVIKEVVKVPYGQYKLSITLDGKSENMMVNVHGCSVIQSHLHRKYKLVIQSDVNIDWVTIGNGHAVAVHANVFSCQLVRGTYTVQIHASIHSNESGVYETCVNLDKDTTIDLGWCPIHVETNGKDTASFQQEGTSVKEKLTHNGSFSILAVRHTKYKLQLTSPHGKSMYTETITPHNEEKIDISRNWGDFTIIFDRSSYKNKPCFYRVSNKRIGQYEDVEPYEAVDIRGRIPQNLKITFCDCPFGRYWVSFGIDHDDYTSGYRTFDISNQGSIQLSCIIPTMLIDKPKWRKLRLAFFYFIWLLCLPLIFMGSIYIPVSVFLTRLAFSIMADNQIVLGCAVVYVISSLVLGVYYCSLIFRRSKKVMYVCLWCSLINLVVGIVAAYSDYTYTLLPHDLKGLLVLWPLFLHAIPLLGSYFLYKQIKIKGKGVWDELFPI